MGAKHSHYCAIPALISCIEIMDNLFWYKLYFCSYFTNNGSLSLFTQAMDFSLSFASASASWLGCSCWKSKSVFPVKSLKVPDNESYCKRLMKAWSEKIILNDRYVRHSTLQLHVWKSQHLRNTFRVYIFDVKTKTIIIHPPKQYCSWMKHLEWHCSWHCRS